MIKIELIRNITKKFDVGELEAASFVDCIFDSIIKSFQKGKNINIPEFGKFSIINKTKNGLSQKYVTFSPVKKFADSVNENFTDLEPQLTKIYHLKNNASLKIREVLPDSDNEDFIYFVFEDEEYSYINDSDELQSVDTFIPEQSAEEEEKTVITADEDTGKKVQTVFDVDNLKDIEDIKIEEVQDVFKDTNHIIPEDKFIDDEKPLIASDSDYLLNIPESIINSEQNIFIPDNKADEEITGQNVIDEEISPVVPEKSNETEESIQDLSPAVFLHKENIEDDFGEEDIEKDILDLLVKREEILREMRLFDSITLIHPETDTNEDKKDTIKPQGIGELSTYIEQENISESKYEEPIIPGETIPQDDAVNTDDSLFTELEKRIKELDELTKKQDEIINLEKAKPQNPELKIFDRLIDDSKVIEELPPEPEITTSRFPEVVVEEFKSEEKEPKTLTDALENIKLDGIIEHIAPEEGKDEAKSFEDVFKSNDKQFVPQFTAAEDKHSSQGRFFKVFLYIFFVFLVSAFAFYIYKSLFTGSNGGKVIDTIGLTKIDSVRQMLAKTKPDSTSKSDSMMKKEEKEIKGESVEIKNLNGVIYRELGKMIFIQNKVVDDINEASEIEVKLKLNNLSCRVEAVMTLQNKLEYRVLVGPFETIEKASEYYEINKAVLNFIQIMNPRKTNLLVL